MLFATPDFPRSHHIMFTFTIWRYFGRSRVSEISWSKFNFFLKTFILRKMTYTGRRKAVFPSWCQGGFKMPLPQVDDDHVSKWRASRWCSYLNMLKLSGLWRTTSPCHCVHKGLWYESLCVISRRKRYEVGSVHSAFTVFKRTWLEH